ncbi:MAG: hypothetical protein C4575_06670 [Desulforudis sp.]|jgi:hypothetical protein|nr:MAG: hypothetical protein C4575_06670 [Desulforudis sp.]
MLKFIWLFFIAFSLSTNCFSADGYIQIKSMPGVEIYLDGKAQGLTTKELNGMVIQNIPPGPHKISAKFNNLKPQDFNIIVTSGKVEVIAVNEFVNKIGELVIQTLPIDATIYINDKVISKTKDELQLELPIGKYEVVSEGVGKKLKHTVVVSDQQRSHLLFNMIEGTTQDIGEKNRKIQELSAQVVAKAGFEILKLPDGNILKDKKGSYYELNFSRQVEYDVNSQDKSFAQLESMAKNFRLNRYTGWRLPREKDLESLQRLADELSKLSNDDYELVFNTLFYKSPPIKRQSSLFYIYCTNGRHKIQSIGFYKGQSLDKCGDGTPTSGAALFFVR